jgi:nucleotide sugar dehydrogenase
MLANYSVCRQVGAGAADRAEVRGTTGLTSFRDLLPTARQPEFVPRPVVCVQGLGFVGSAMAVALAGARAADGTPCFNVVGVDLDTARGRHAIEHLENGRFPFATTDQSLIATMAEAACVGNIATTCDPAAYGLAETIVVDVNLDLDFAVEGDADGADGPRLDLTKFRVAIRTLAQCMRPDALVVVETTVPPGTCTQVVAPEIEAVLRARGLTADRFLLVHSYERVMPGADYLNSIVNYWRVYAGHTAEAGDACAAFLSKIINVERFPLRRLSSTTASETAKVLENSYRAVNIAFIEEWSRFAESIEVDLFEIVDAIRQRPTHSNIRQPGFGVGGYCLPKDPLMALAAAREFYGLGQLDFPFCHMAVKVNHAMPLVSLEMVEGLLGGSLMRKRIALFGISYRPGVADTRHAPAAIFVKEAVRRGAILELHDPLVQTWPELGVEVSPILPDPGSVDALVFATAHLIYRELNPHAWLNGARPVVLDSNDVLTVDQRGIFRKLGCQVASIGRGSDPECES